LTLAPRAKLKPESEVQEARVPPLYITHQEISVLFGFENIEAYHEHNRLQCEEHMRLADEKLERAAATARCFAIRPVVHSCNLRNRVGAQLRV
jgi:hypothetical protein